MKIVNFTLMLFLSAGLFSCTVNGQPSDSEESATPATLTSMATHETEATPAEPLAITSVSFIEDQHNFGEVVQGDKVSHVFKFKNTGVNPLRIQEVKPSCGCTAPTYSKEDIAPGEEGSINVVFDSKGKSGVQKKSVNVIFENTNPKVKLLSFNCEVMTNE